MIGRYIFIRDGRLSRTTRIVLLLLVLLALLALFPLRLALGAANTSGSLSAREVEGVVWSGAAGDLHAGSLPLGSLYIGLRPLPLLLGRAEFALDRPAAPGQAEFRAIARGGEGRVAVRDANGEIALGGRMAPLPVRAITMADFAMETRAGKCVSASGTVGIVITSLGPMLPGETIMSGPAKCEDGALVTRMQGPTGTEHLHLTLEADSTWHADLVLSGLPVEVTAPLLDMGFTSRATGIGLAANGTL